MTLSFTSLIPNFFSRSLSPVTICTTFSLLKPPPAVLLKRINWWWKRIWVMYETARQKCIKTHGRSHMRIKSTLRALSQFSSRSITIKYFLQKFLFCNTLCGDTTNAVFSRSYLDFRACCSWKHTLSVESFSVHQQTLKCLDDLHKIPHSGGCDKTQRHCLYKGIASQVA